MQLLFLLCVVLVVATATAAGVRVAPSQGFVGRVDGDLHITAPPNATVFINGVDVLGELASLKSLLRSAVAAKTTTTAATTTATTATTTTPPTTTPPPPPHVQRLTQGATRQAVRMSLQLNSRGFPVVVFVQDGLRLTVCHDRLCAVPPTERLLLAGVPASSVVPGSATLQLRPDDRPVVAFLNNVDWKNPKLTLLLCDDANCTSSVSRVLTASSGGSLWSSMQLTSDGVPVVSYFSEFFSKSGSDDVYSTFITLVVCSDADCATHTTHQLDATSQTGGSSSFVGRLNVLQLLGAGDGTSTSSQLRPVVASEAQEGVAVSRCGDLACASGLRHESFLGTKPYMAQVPAGAERTALVFLGFNLTSRETGVGFALCNATACEPDFNMLTLAEPYADTLQTMVQLDPITGWPVVAFFNDSYTALVVLRCGDHACRGPLAAGPTAVPYTAFGLTDNFQGSSDDWNVDMKLASDTGFPVFALSPRDKNTYIVTCSAPTCAVQQ